MKVGIEIDGNYDRALKVCGKIDGAREIILGSGRREISGMERNSVVNLKLVDCSVPETRACWRYITITADKKSCVTCAAKRGGVTVNLSAVEENTPDSC